MRSMRNSNNTDEVGCFFLLISILVVCYIGYNVIKIMSYG